jgi:mRNA interferase MazF
MKFQKWEIYRASLDPVVGSEQGKSRPVLIVSEDLINDLLNTVNVLPLTSRKEGRTIYPNEALLDGSVHGLPHESIVLCHQIRTLDKHRLTTFYGKVSDTKIILEIEEALSFQLGLDD